MPRPSYTSTHTQVMIPKTVAAEARALCPTSSLTRITLEALQLWIAREQRNADLIALVKGASQ